MVTLKTISNGGVTNGVWNYTYSPGTSTRDDITTITHPHGDKTEYQHFGVSHASNGTVWKIGTLTSKRHINFHGGVAR